MNPARQKIGPSHFYLQQAAALLEEIEANHPLMSDKDRIDLAMVYATMAQALATMGR